MGCGGRQSWYSRGNSRVGGDFQCSWKTYVIRGTSTLTLFVTLTTEQWRSLEYALHGTRRWETWEREVSRRRLKAQRVGLLSRCCRVQNYVGSINVNAK